MDDIDFEISLIRRDNINVAYILEISVNTLVMIAILLILFSTIVTYRIIKNDNINSTIMNINFKIVSLIFPIMLK